MNYGNTKITTSQPWGTMHRQGTKLLCSDGKVRTVAYLANTPDTFFSTPAAMRIKRKYVSGYMTVEESADGKRAYVFRQHDGNADSLPDWPKKFTPEHDMLISQAHLTT
jgi:hypothetical protein